MERSKDRIFANSGGDFDRECGASSPRLQYDGITIGEIVLPGNKWVHFCQRVRHVRAQWLNAPRLCTRLILSEHTPGGQIQGILAINGLGGRLMTNSVKERFSCWCWETILKQARCTGMILRWAGPEDTSLNFFVSDARIISDATGAGAAQFCEDLLSYAWSIVVEVASFAQASG